MDNATMDAAILREMEAESRELRQVFDAMPPLPPMDMFIVTASGDEASEFADTTRSLDDAIALADAITLEGFGSVAIYDGDCIVEFYAATLAERLLDEAEAVA